MTHSIQNSKLKVGLISGSCLALLIANARTQTLPLALGWTLHELAWGIVALACLNLAFQLTLSPSQSQTGWIKWLSIHLPGPKVSLMVMVIGLLVGSLIDCWLS